MFRTLTVTRAICVVLLSTVVAGAASVAPPDRAQPAIEGGGAAEQAPNWSDAEYVFTAKLDSADAGPVAQSFPPIYSHTLHFTVEKVLRGSLKPGARIDCSHSARQMNAPSFPVGQVCLVAASGSRGQMQAQIVELSTPERLAQVTLACSLPMGWKLEGGKPVSPWASMGKNAWSNVTGVKGELICSQTGRPALLAGNDVTFQVEPVPPDEEIQWTNPDGDGEYKITVTNATDKPITVPALLAAGDKTLCDESLVIICQQKVYPCPGSRGVSGEVKPVTLGPGQSVSTVVNALALQGPEWPRGGYRIEFQFCLGEKSQTMSFYYLSRHHDKIREAGSSDGSASDSSGS